MPLVKQRDPATGEVLVAILNNLLDFDIALNQRWYRVPIDSAEKWLKRRWPPSWIAFYHTSAFPVEKHTVSYYAKVINVEKAVRWQLFPNEPHTGKGSRHYYKLILEPLVRLPQPIISKRARRIVFIQTTWQKFLHATEINDLFDASPLEAQLWSELTRLEIAAERQYLLDVSGRSYFLDFAILCTKGNLAVETDGDTWHADPRQIPLDNQRDNDMETVGWRLLRFSTPRIRERMHDYCLPMIVDMITRLGGVEEGRLIPRQVSLDSPTKQLSIFDEPPTNDD